MNKYTKNTPAKSWRKQQTSKIISRALAIHLKIANRESNQAKGYENSIHCASRIILDLDNKTIKEFKMCKRKNCQFCARKKGIKWLVEYSAAIEKMQDPVFLTLTQQTVSANQLRPRINEMLNIWRQIMKTAKSHHKKQIDGIRKFECKISNGDKTKYHPHFHAIVDGNKNAEYIKNQWIKSWKKAYPKHKGIISIKSQDIKKISSKGAIELFKYFTDAIHSEKDKDGKRKFQDPKKLDIIFNAVHRKRIIQSFGKIRKTPKTPEQKQKFTEQRFNKILQDYEFIWNTKINDWQSPDTGERIVGIDGNQNWLDITKN